MRTPTEGGPLAGPLRRSNRQATWFVGRRGFFVGVPTRAACAAVAIKEEDARPLRPLTARWLIQVQR
jgi:hypothetical protein